MTIFVYLLDATTAHQLLSQKHRIAYSLTENAADGHDLKVHIPTLPSLGLTVGHGPFSLDVNVARI